MADLAAGTLGSAATIPTGNVQSTAYLRVRLYNNTGATVTILAGGLSAHVECHYTHSVLQSMTNQGCQAVVSAGPGFDLDGGYVLALNHYAGVAWTPDGEIGTAVHDFSEIIEQRGNFDMTSESLYEVSANLVFDEIVLDPGESLSLVAQLTTGVAGGSTDANTTPMTLALELPPGVSFDTNATVPLAWVTH